MTSSPPSCLWRGRLRRQNHTVIGLIINAGLYLSRPSVRPTCSQNLALGLKIKLIQQYKTKHEAFAKRLCYALDLISRNLVNCMLHNCSNFEVPSFTSSNDRLPKQQKFRPNKVPMYWQRKAASLLPLNKWPWLTWDIPPNFIMGQQMPPNWQLISPTYTWFCSLVQPESTCQTASWSVQSFLAQLTFVTNRHRHRHAHTHNAMQQ